MNTDKHRNFSRKFYTHIESFLNSHLDLTQNSSIKFAVGVSGGPDSVALLYFCHYLKKKYDSLDFIILHFNHLSRPKENLEEEQFVFQLCNNLKFRFHCKKNIDPDNKTEISWRKQRQLFFQESLAQFQCHYLFLAHHIDDSFEWSNMQRAKSGHVKGSIGIPVINGKIFRPFMCVSKNQILNFLNKSQIKFMVDSSNMNDSHERNWWRIHILDKIKKKYPKVLHHYVQYANELALKLGVIYKQTPPAKLKIIDEQTHLYHFEKMQRVQDSFHLLRKSLHVLSSKKRMKLRQQLKSVAQAYKNNKLGPIHFTGGVKAYVYRKSILITNKVGANNENVVELIKRNIPL